MLGKVGSDDSICPKLVEVDLNLKLNEVTLNCYGDEVGVNSGIVEVDFVVDYSWARRFASTRNTMDDFAVNLMNVAIEHVMMDPTISSGTTSLRTS